MMLADAVADSGFAYIIGAIAIYFAPSLVAWKAKRTSTSAIFILNLLAGWTFIGWLISLVWALKTDPAAIATTIIYAPSPQPAPVLPTQPAMTNTGATPSLPSQDFLPTHACPSCFSQIPLIASVCRYCQRDVPPAA